MKNKLKLLCCFLVSFDAFAATCPSGYIQIERNSLITLAATCPIVTLATASELSFPGIKCAANLTTLNLSNDVQIPLYATQHTTPSLHIKTATATKCYINLVPGTTTHGINLSSGDTTYHVTDLKVCSNLSPDTTPQLISPNTNTSNWSSTSDNITISGISHCASQTATIGTTATSLTTSSTASSNINCWCRLTTPNSSKWVFSYKYSSSSNCNTYCVASCAENFVNSTTFRTNIITQISDLYH